MATRERLVDVAGTAVRLTTLDRVLFPATGFTKADLIDYYARIAPVLLPHIAGYPLTLHRFPEGVGGPSFFQTRAPSHPEWVRVQRMHTFRTGKEVDAVVLDDLPGLVWAANLSAIELHPYLGPAHDLEHPRIAVFDLDPGSPADIVDACVVALEVRDLLDTMAIRSWPKASGGRGVHVVVPVTNDHTFTDTKAFVRAVARVLARDHPDRITDQMARSQRAGRVFIDWSQNHAGKSTVAPYSMRGGHVPTVAMPLVWTEIEHAVRTGDRRHLVVDPDGALARVAADGDVMGGVFQEGAQLPR